MKHNQRLSQSPLFLHLPEATNQGALIVSGQGVIGVQPAAHEPFCLQLMDSNDDSHWITLRIDGQGDATETRSSARITVYEERQPAVVFELDGQGGGLDPDRACRYWLSLDCFDAELRYGKGEARKNTTLLTGALESKEEYAWLRHLDSFTVATPEGEPLRGDVVLWRDPVVVEPPLLVVRNDEMTMEMAACSTGTVAQNLSPACQRLYATVAGNSFQLNTPDFPFFAEAIEQSIADPTGWCYQMLKEKASEFGSEDPSATYLRITLGKDLGNSPGVPFVMEIWPAGHHSPIHNHADAFAVIKVLYGEIHVELFDMLSIHHQTPFAEATFKQGEVTWLAPRLNQTHRLSNINRVGPVCVTIQCYQYGEENRTHYEYFDYINTEGTGIGHFEPNSDMDYLEFKALMQEEWKKRNRYE